MAYIAFDLDAFSLVPQVAQAADVQPSIIGWGLAQLWQWCWRAKADAVTLTHLKGFFGSDVSDALVTFGFLERSSGGFRVRGAGRYLRIHKAQSEAGKKAIGNLKQNHKPEPESVPHPKVEPVGEPEGSRDRAGTDPEGKTGSYSEQRTASSDKRTANQQQAPPEKGRRKRVSDRLSEIFLEARQEKYKFAHAKDGEALGRILGACDDDEAIFARWRRGLFGSGWERVSTIAQLDTKWNDLAGPVPSAPRQPTKGAGYTNGGNDWAEGVDQVAALFGLPQEKP